MESLPNKEFNLQFKDIKKEIDKYVNSIGYLNIVNKDYQTSSNLEKLSKIVNNGFKEFFENNYSSSFKESSPHSVINFIYFFEFFLNYPFTIFGLENEGAFPVFIGKLYGFDSKKVLYSENETGKLELCVKEVDSELNSNPDEIKFIWLKDFNTSNRKIISVDQISNDLLKKLNVVENNYSKFVDNYLLLNTPTVEFKNYKKIRSKLMSPIHYYL